MPSRCTRLRWKKGYENELLDQKAQAYLEQSLSTRNYVPRHELYLLRRLKAKLAANLGKEGELTTITRDTAGS